VQLCTRRGRLAAENTRVKAALQVLGDKRNRADERVDEGGKLESVRLLAAVQKGRETLKLRPAEAIILQGARAQRSALAAYTRAERVALDDEKAAMEKTFAFQMKTILLNVWGVSHKVETSLPTLSSVPDIYLLLLRPLPSPPILVPILNAVATPGSDKLGRALGRGVLLHFWLNVSLLCGLRLVVSVRVAETVSSQLS